MKLHPSSVNNVLYLCSNYGGHKDEKRLVEQLQNMLFATYLEPNTQNICLVDAKKLVQELRARNIGIENVLPMQFHSSVIQKIMYNYEMYSGHSDERKFRNSLESFDLTPYERKLDGVGNTVLVLTQDYVRTLQGVQTT